MVPMLRNASVYGEYENDVVKTGNRMIAVGADYQLGNKSRFYARHEFISALGGPFELNSMHSTHHVAGLETDYMKDGQLFNEYRARSASMAAKPKPRRACATFGMWPRACA